MAEAQLDKSKTPVLGQVTAQLWAAFGAAAGMQIEFEVYDRSVAMGQLKNVESRLANFANETYHKQALSCATQAGTISAEMACAQGVDLITPEIFEKAAEKVRISQQGTGGITPSGGIC